MSYHERLAAEIHRHLEEWQQDKRDWNAGKIAGVICEIHSSGLSDDEEHAEFWQYGGARFCRDEVRRCINKRAGLGSEASKQCTLPGFEHLQDYYVVKRDEIDVGVHRDEMTDDDIEEKASALETMGVACFAHAKELRRFRKLRAEQKALVAAE